MAQPAAAFLSRDFLRYQLARVVVIMGAEAQALAVAWQVYQITHRAIDLGYTGLILFLPGLFFMLPAGHVADRFDRRQVILVCYVLQAVCTLVLFGFAWRGIDRVWPIFALLFAIGTGRAFSGPASSALVPHLVPKEHFVNAITGAQRSFSSLTLLARRWGACCSLCLCMGGCVEDPVGAPIFFRDVPLIPSVGEKGVISPLPRGALGFVKWELRSVGETKSKVLMGDLPTCANCHSFSRDGKELGLDVDGPQNDKGLYALVPIANVTAIRNENVIKWSSYLPFQKSVNIRVSFMSQVSPNGRYVVNMINDPGADKHSPPGMRPQERIYVANFKDYRFGQVFYPTRGVLAWYDRETREFHTLPGANDPRLVQCGAFWSPDGKYIIFSRAGAKEPFPEGSKLALFANDPNETQIQYDLYRLPFNDGRGGVAEPIAGASQNGFSNSFPKVSPDGRWIVFVQARNGLLMRPDSRLFIVPFKGGKARLMKCNTRLMNSWHSFSPNGRWLVFSSKARSPYTQMYLTHIDKDGNDSPPVLIEDATAANRAVNIPEFVNLQPATLEKIDHPATDYYRVFDRAWDLAEKRRYADAILEWRKAIELNPEEARPHLQLGLALGETGQVDQEIAEYRQALQMDPNSAPAYANLGIALQGQGKLAGAIEAYRKSLELDSNNSKARSNLAVALLEDGRTEEGIEQCKATLAEDPQNGDAHNALGIVLARKGELGEAILHLDAAVAGAPGKVDYQFNLGRVLAAAGRFGDAIPHLRAASDLTSWREPVILDLLAATYGEVRQFREAADVARRALAEAQRQNNRDLIHTGMEASTITSLGTCRLVLPARESTIAKPGRSS